MRPTDDLSALRYVRMRWNTPLSEEHAALLLQRLDVRPGVRLLDLGCGWGELLLRAIAAGGVPRDDGAERGDDGGDRGDDGREQADDGGEWTSGPGRDATTGIGVDTDDAALARGRALATDRSLDDRVTFVHGHAASWREPADRLLCIGAAHAFGGTSAALQRLADLVRPGGRLLFGDAYWERPPTAEATEIFGNDVLPLADFVEQIRQMGWRVLHLSTADQREWDDFESTWRAGEQEWLLAHPEDPRTSTLQERLDTRLREYVAVYRGLLGFAYVILGR